MFVYINFCRFTLRNLREHYPVIFYTCDFFSIFINNGKRSCVIFVIVISKLIFRIFMISVNVIISIFIIVNRTNYAKIFGFL